MMECERLDQFDLDWHKLLSLQVIQVWLCLTANLGKDSKPLRSEKAVQTKSFDIQLTPTLACGCQDNVLIANNSNSKGHTAPK
ncbi:hypothetical protein LCGC14_1738560 [marine sediment metagenome]|uniref:Uncharacterized protein n=1 Tax=marine sediment metagenome TaxID=412755 RepID=A0A0F9JMP0_9ZZZZ